ncbi:MAG: zinc-ribbon domain-containing protein [Clostridia bacterium]|nr:zinc-ribbon domain-containing protein [Clostridia bacterium]
MKCNVCNAELRDDQSFCAYCGTKVENNAVAESPAQAETPVYTDAPASVSTEENPGKKNAKTGLIFGILSYVIPFVGLIFGIIGIVNSAKGLKSESKGMAIPGLVLSIVGTVENVIIILYTLFFVATWLLMMPTEGTFETLSFLSQIL